MADEIIGDEVGVETIPSNRGPAIMESAAWRGNWRTASPCSVTAEGEGALEELIFPSRVVRGEATWAEERNVESSPIRRDDVAGHGGSVIVDADADWIADSKRRRVPAPRWLLDPMAEARLEELGPTVERHPSETEAQHLDRPWGRAELEFANGGG